MVGTRTSELVLVLLSALLILPGASLAQRLPPGQLELRPKAGETETVQAGGPDGVYTWGGVLRCQSPEQAIVGFRIRRGSVLDYLQIICAEIQCPGGQCRWTRYLSTASVGDPQGGQSSSLLLCGQDEAIAGYRASVRPRTVGGGPMELGGIRLQPGVTLNYVEDVAIQCARITGPVDPATPNAVPVARDERSWKQAEGHLAPRSGESFLAPAGTCRDAGASAVAAFAGRYLGASFANVVQAMGLFCGGAPRSCPAGTGAHSYFKSLEVGLYNPRMRRPANAYCPECCKHCVTMQGSANPVTGRTDREVANLPVPRYNCDFYTLSYMNYVAAPTGKGRVPRRLERANIFGQVPEFGECLDEQDFINYGFTKVQEGAVNPGQLRPGDIVSVWKTSLIVDACRNAHSGIVISSGSDGVIIRQKPNPDDCVTDFNWDEFLVAYDARNRSRVVKVWRLNK